MSFGNEREFIDLQQLEERREQTMKCPLITSGFWADPGTSGELAIDCLKKECAWWEKGTKRCAVLEVNEMLAGLCVLLAEIKAKMPHAGQFTK